MPKHATLPSTSTGKILRDDGTWTDPPSGSGPTSHGSLTGLGADDHTQYLNNARGDARYDAIGAAAAAASGASAALTAHTNAADPHPGYLTPAEGNAAYAALGHDHAGIYQPLAAALTGTTASFTTALETKLNGVAAGAEVNVNADWSAGSGDAQILNKPSLGTASPLNVAASGDAAAGEVVKGDDTRLTDARTPTAHSHSGLLPAGGAAGQVPKKLSAADFDYGWGNDDTGAGGSGHTGTATLDFGAYPGTTDTSVGVSGQTTIAEGSVVQAWIRPIATANRSEMDHVLDPPRVCAASIVAGVGFTIYGFTENTRRHYGQYSVAWSWK